MPGNTLPPGIELVIGICLIIFMPLALLGISRESDVIEKAKTGDPIYHDEVRKNNGLFLFVLIVAGIAAAAAAVGIGQ